MLYVTLIKEIYKRLYHGKKIGGLNVTNLVDAAKSGNKKEILIAMRDKLAETIQNCDSGRDMASNTKRLMEVVNEIETIEAKEAEEAEKKKAHKQSKFDRLKKKSNEDR
jgi:hypothetical protein